MSAAHEETDGTTRQGIVMFDAERDAGYYHPSLELDYIDDVGNDIAESIAKGMSAEAAYQPGDWTFYGIVVTPLTSLIAARSKSGSSEHHAVRGMARGDESGTFEYPDATVIVCWVDHGCYPFDISDPRGLAASYVGEKLGSNAVSGASIALLLRSVAYHLDRRTF